MNEKDFLVEVFEAADLKKQNEQLREMFDMQVKLVTNLQLENDELRNIIDVLTNNKLPCNPDHNGECLVCDNWLCDCPLQQNEIPTI
jgi:hypothetical protein